MSFKIQSFLDKALAQQGDKYVFGYEADGQADPDTFDCSELVEWAVAQAGGSITDGSQAQRASVQPMDVEQALATPGALLFTDGHVGIALGKKDPVSGKWMTMEAKGTQYGTGVFTTDASNWLSAGLIPGGDYNGVVVPDNLSPKGGTPGGGGVAGTSGVDGGQTGRGGAGGGYFNADSYVGGTKSSIMDPGARRSIQRSELDDWLNKMLWTRLEEEKKKAVMKAVGEQASFKQWAQNNGITEVTEDTVKSYLADELSKAVGSDRNLLEGKSKELAEKTLALAPEAAATAAPAPTATTPPPAVEPEPVVTEVNEAPFNTVAPATLSPQPIPA